MHDDHYFDIISAPNTYSSTFNTEMANDIPEMIVSWKYGN